MAVVENGVVLAICLGYLIERLRNEVGADAIPGHERERRFEEIEPPQRRELVEHHYELMPAGLLRVSFQPLGQPPPDLVQDQPRQCASRRPRSSPRR